MTGTSVAALVAACAEGSAWAAEVAALDGRGQTRAIVRAVADGPGLRLDMRLRFLRVRELSDHGLTAIVTTIPNLHRLSGTSRYSDFALMAAHCELVARGRADILDSLHGVVRAVESASARLVVVDPPGQREVSIPLLAWSPLSGMPRPL